MNYAGYMFIKIFACMVLMKIKAAK